MPSTGGAVTPLGMYDDRVQFTVLCEDPEAGEDLASRRRDL